MRLARLFLFFWGVFLVSCSGLPYKFTRVPPGYVFPDPEGDGVVYFSVRGPEQYPRNSLLPLYFDAYYGAASDAMKKGELSLLRPLFINRRSDDVFAVNENIFSLPFQGSYSGRDLIVLQLPPGGYGLVAYSFLSNGSFINAYPQGMRFDVQENIALYLGRIVISESDGAVKTSVLDSYEEDTDSLLFAVPGIAFEETKKGVMR